MSLIETVIIDDLLPPAYANEIERVMFSNTFPWYFLEDITYVRPDLLGGSKTPALAHQFYGKNGASEYFNLIQVIPFIAMQKANGGSFSRIQQARTFMQFPLANAPVHNNVHVDYDFPHIACLYYVNDTDGATFMFANDKVTVTQAVTPKKNRVVLFDGSIYHSSSNPTQGKRAVINFDLIV
jgi:hypothetical protein